MMHHRISLFLGGLMLGLISVGNAQITGYTAELDTAFGDIPSGDPLAGLAYHGVYDIYATFTSPEDVLSSLYALNDPSTTTPAMGIEAPCGCFNPTPSPLLIDASNNALLFEGFPEYAYDSFWTIGMADVMDEGELPQYTSLQVPNNLCEGFTITDGIIFGVGGGENGFPANMVAGDDLKILVARVTTCGDFSLNACAQVFVGGSQDTTCCVQQWCPDEPLFVEHVVLGCTNPDACNYNAFANQDDASCVFVAATCDDMNELTVGDVYQDDCDCKGYSCYDPFACNFSTAGLQDDDLCFYVLNMTLLAALIPFSSTLQTYTYTELQAAPTSGLWKEAVSLTVTERAPWMWFGPKKGMARFVSLKPQPTGAWVQEVCLDVTVRLSSVQELPQGQLEIYPNPARDWLQLQWTGPVLNNACIVLRDASGRVVLSQHVAEQESLDVSSFGAGAYVLEFSVPEFGSIQRQVVIQ